MFTRDQERREREISGTEIIHSMLSFCCSQQQKTDQTGIALQFNPPSKLVDSEVAASQPSDARLSATSIVHPLFCTSACGDSGMVVIDLARKLCSHLLFTTCI